jgi:hypothetical protein
MPELHLHFVAFERSNPPCVEAAAILCESLRRQGFASSVLGRSVTINMPERPASEPDQIYVVLDEQLLSEVELLNRFDRQSAVVICSARPVQTLRHELGRYTAAIATVDAEGIGDDEGASPVIALLGGAARMLPFIDAEQLGIAIWMKYDRSFPYAARAAVRAFDLGYAQTQQLIG